MNSSIHQHKHESEKHKGEVGLWGGHQHIESSEVFRLGHAIGYDDIEDYVQEDTC